MAYLGKLQLKTAPTEEIVATTDVKENCRIDYNSTDEDDYIEDIIKSVREFSEKLSDRAFLTQSWYYYLNKFPDEDYIEIPRLPLQQINSITYTDYNNDAATFTTGYYNWNVLENLIYLEYGQSWPSYTEKPYGSVVIDFTAGSTSIASFKDTHMDLYQWNVATCARLFDNRELKIGDISLRLPERLFRFR
jgi:uncharacterized phiE125 gp8 family phage protein